MMIETKPKSRAMLLAKAARMAGFDAGAGWPAELCDVSLACLFAEVETCRHDNDADLWLNMIDNAIKSGELVSARFVKPNDDGGDLIFMSVRGGWNYLTREAVADWLRITGETPGELARAWLGDLWQVGAAAGNEEVGAGGTAPDTASKAKAGGRPKGKQGEQLQKIIDALAAWAAKKGESFDSNNMPGQVGDADVDGSFHWLCVKLYPSEFRKGKKAFKGYRAGRCVFPAYAKTSDFYSRAISDIAQSLGVSLNVTAIKPASRKAT